jgi:hypothetical protein
MTPLAQPIPAQPPISGPLWSIVVPAALFVVTFVATWLLYRRFSRERGR